MTLKPVSIPHNLLVRHLEDWRPKIGSAILLEHRTAEYKLNRLYAVTCLAGALLGIGLFLQFYYFSDMKSLGFITGAAISVLSLVAIPSFGFWIKNVVNHRNAEITKIEQNQDKTEQSILEMMTKYFDESTSRIVHIIKLFHSLDQQQASALLQEITDTFCVQDKDLSQAQKQILETFIEHFIDIHVDDRTIAYYPIHDLAIVHRNLREQANFIATALPYTSFDRNRINKFYEFLFEKNQPFFDTLIANIERLYFIAEVNHLSKRDRDLIPSLDPHVLDSAVFEHFIKVKKFRIAFLMFERKMNSEQMKKYFGFLSYEIKGKFFIELFRSYTLNKNLFSELSQEKRRVFRSLNEELHQLGDGDALPTLREFMESFNCHELIKVMKGQLSQAEVDMLFRQMTENILPPRSVYLWSNMVWYPQSTPQSS